MKRKEDEAGGKRVERMTTEGERDEERDGGGSVLIEILLIFCRPFSTFWRLNNPV